jgi:large subunit ribosomal protein L29
MKAHELRAMTREELTRRIDELTQELFNLRFQKATKQLSDTSRTSQVRRDIARAKTILRELELAAEVE